MKIYLVFCFVCRSVWSTVLTVPYVCRSVWSTVLTVPYVCRSAAARACLESSSLSGLQQLPIHQLGHQRPGRANVGLQLNVETIFCIKIVFIVVIMIKKEWVFFKLWSYSCCSGQSLEQQSAQHIIVAYYKAVRI